MSCFSPIVGTKCDECEYQAICKYAEITDCTDNGDECENCPCDNKSGHFPKKHYKIGPRWFTQQ